MDRDVDAGWPPVTAARSLDRGPVPGLPDPGRTLVMGVVNVTPDSFSDGGAWFDPDAAIRHGLDLVAEGADLVDVGGESTRPGASRVDAAEEWRRIGPVVSRLSAAGAVVSVDTTRAEVARRAVDAGAVLVNDVSGGNADPAMLGAVADLGVAYVCMHWRGPSADMQRLASYDDVAADVRVEVGHQVATARAAGVAPARIVVDPGFGFAKTGDHNWELLVRLSELADLGHPLLVGVSRKAFLGTLLSDASGPRPPVGRDEASVALTTLMAAAGVWAVRVHTVRPHRDAVAVVARWWQARDEATGTAGASAKR